MFLDFCLNVVNLCGIVKIAVIFERALVPTIGFCKNRSLVNVFGRCTIICASNSLMIAMGLTVLGKLQKISFLANLCNLPLLPFLDSIMLHTILDYEINGGKALLLRSMENEATVKLFCSFVREESLGWTIVSF
jgi:hypothetical protein